MPRAVSSKTEVIVKVYDPRTGGWCLQVYSATEFHCSTSQSSCFGPVRPEHAGLAFVARRHVPHGARYCEELDAYVPADLTYRIRGIQKHQLPLKKRVLTREFWRHEGENAQVNRIVSAIGLTHGTMNLVPLKDAQRNANIKYRGLDDL
ncbi:hypothetical protein CERSUDRAFT_96014 [Gelatoporia subvermispora B]|uniref:Uncharacterized protein n=1 Tax=Ceriporiopsis subvermispora (strain B) TaxID=914234 RepID=M2QUN8_CERS8|nr:hypothetical protein CERSUDRAFT_96014 [Gelatoporia subvermispora B]